MRELLSLNTMEKTDGKPPVLTIGVPVYNAENFLRKTLEGLLAQTFDDFEIIISDNASTDSTQAICEEFACLDSRISYFRYTENRGAAWNFNNTVHKARGRYFKWAAHDDLHKPEFMEKCIEALENQPNTVLAFARTVFIDADDQEIREYVYPVDLYETPAPVRFRHFVAGGHIVHEVFGVIRTEVLRQTDLIGGYLGSDLVLLGDLALRGAFYQVPEVLFLHREHDQRSMLKPQGADNMTQWYDASKSGQFVMPYWKRAFMNFKTLFRVPMPLSQRLQCLLEWCRACSWSRGNLSEELTAAINYRFRRQPQPSTER
jgi:glycosyltransferase involved in cell wall biosynthesis